MEGIIKKYGQLASADLRTNPSQNPRIKEHRTNNEYFKTWRYRYDKGSKTAIVYNKKNGRLTYLLENGHAITNAKGGIKWTRAFPHISITFDRFKGKFVEDMRKAPIKTDLT